IVVGELGDEAGRPRRANEMARGVELRDAALAVGAGDLLAPALVAELPQRAATVRRDPAGTRGPRLVFVALHAAIGPLPAHDATLPVVDDLQGAARRIVDQRQVAGGVVGVADGCRPARLDLDELALGIGVAHEL